MKMRHTTLIATCLVLLAPAGLAQNEKKTKKDDATQTKAVNSDASRLEAIFKAYDRNKDGNVVREEFPGSDYQFGALDGNKNKKITLKEFIKSPLAKRFLSRVRYNRNQRRERYTPSAELEKQRMAALARYDRNRDGKLVRAEWIGSEHGFRLLDRNGDGALSKADTTAAAKPAEGPKSPQLSGPSFTGGWERLMMRYDSNRDGGISRAEAGNSKVGRLFAAMDTDQSGELTEREVRYAYRALEQLNYMKNSGARSARKPRRIRYNIPFDSWDKDENGTIDQSEYQGRGELFGLMDRNRDAVLSKAEVATFLREVNNTEFIKKYDANGDGRVVRSEFPGTDEVFRRADRNGDGVIAGTDR